MAECSCCCRPLITSLIRAPHLAPERVSLKNEHANFGSPASSSDGVPLAFLRFPNLYRDAQDLHARAVWSFLKFARM